MEIENNICAIELLMNNPIIRGKTDHLDLVVFLDDENKRKEKLGTIDVKEDKFIIESRKLIDSSRLVNALMRASLIKPNLEPLRTHISQWDDIILGLDTNVFYTGLVTSCLLDEFVRIPSGDFIDSPDWVTIVLSKVAMGEIENRANRPADIYDRRESLRAIQEIMLINKSKDLEGISLFLAGTIPPEFQFSNGTKNTVRDSAIREQFRVFLKNLDFHKGSYFITQDFNNSVLAEAEGLISLYIKKPKIEKTEFDLRSNNFTVSELIYELAVPFNPVILESDNIEIHILNNWREKTLEEWEEWKIHIEWENDSQNIQQDIDQWMSGDTAMRMLQGWDKLKKRYVRWLEYQL